MKDSTGDDDDHADFLLPQLACLNSWCNRGFSSEQNLQFHLETCTLKAYEASLRGQVPGFLKWDPSTPYATSAETPVTLPDDIRGLYPMRHGFLPEGAPVVLETPGCKDF